MSLDGLRNVREFFITETEIFRLFDIAHFDTLIQDIEITLVHRDTGNTFDYKSLSEGEQQLITITGLNEILIKANSLALMDEPDSYLHPSRQRELIPEILNRFNDFCQILVTTHSPFVAQSVDLNKIQIFEPNKKSTTKVEEDLMSYPVIAEGIFGVKSEFSIEVEEDFEKFRIIRKDIINNKEFNSKELSDLVESLGKKGDEIKAIINREVNQLLKINKNIFKNE
jgi:ABC-type multidrug transport system ATPase subunit